MLPLPSFVCVYTVHITFFSIVRSIYLATLQCKTTHADGLTNEHIPSRPLRHLHTLMQNVQ